ncbi:hypothetical protein [Streptomyces sp. NPDC056525]|uniref:hypothetical protein n=1 Tax=unclassified Streptomyces TaxID=2593676 RepID=UPI003697B70D
MSAIRGENWYPQIANSPNTMSEYEAVSVKHAGRSKLLEPGRVRSCRVGLPESLGPLLRLLEVPLGLLDQPDHLGLTVGELAIVVMRRGYGSGIAASVSVGGDGSWIIRRLYAHGRVVDDVAAGDHLGGGEVFEGLALGGVLRVDSAVDPDAQTSASASEGWIGPRTAACGFFSPVTASAWPGRVGSGRVGSGRRMSRRGVAVYASGGTCRRTSAPPTSR